MRIYNKHRSATNNLSIVAVINKRIWGVKVVGRAESQIAGNPDGQKTGKPEGWLEILWLSGRPVFWLSEPYSL